MAVKALAIDLDGTLLVGEDIPAENVEAVKRASAAGIKVMIATARWSQHAARIGERMGIADPVIACSGAQVRDLAQARDVFDHRLPADFAGELFEICNAERCIATVTFGNDVRLKLEGEPDLGQMGEEMSWVKSLSLDAADLPRIAAVQGTGCIERIRGELGERYADRVNIFDSIGPSGRIIVTITEKTGTKGAALHAACEHLGISADEVVAFGDAENDLEMFRAAGAAVAMGQADETTKSAADFITRANHEAGVAFAIDRILERGSL